MKAHAARVDVTCYLVRHAIAAERGPEWPDDDKRPLTHRGAARMRQAVKGLRALGVRPRVVATSPLVRAGQTARLFVEGLDGSPELVVVPELAPGHDAPAVARALALVSDGRTLAAVGHEPGLGELAGWLLGTSGAPAFKKGGVCCLETRDLARPRSAHLLWMATPRMLRGMAD